MVEAMDEVLKIALAGPLPPGIPATAETAGEPAVSDDAITH
jgi:hypothetical protein